MDPQIAWHQKEHLGPSSDVWNRTFNVLIYNHIFGDGRSNSAFGNSNNVISSVSHPPHILHICMPPPWQERLTHEAIFHVPISKSDTNLKAMEAQHLSQISGPYLENLLSQVLQASAENRKAREHEFFLRVSDFIQQRRATNRATTYAFGISEEFLKNGYLKNMLPWVSPHKSYSQDIQGLHEEIQDFYNYISPTNEEKDIRVRVVERITDVVKQLWSYAQVDVFGSFKTGLFLPTSDIDMVVTLDRFDEVQPLRTLERALQDSGIACDIRVLDRAAVPIIKLKDIETEVRVDIGLNTSGNVNTGTRSADLILTYMRQFPMLAYLVVVLKQFLLQRELNEVWTGGLSSYSLILMCIRFLQDHMQSCQLEGISEPIHNLGKLLIEFFEFYSRQFNYRDLSIRVKDSGAFVRKAHAPDRSSSVTSYLSIEDPFNPDNDIGRGSYRFLHVKNAFEYAYTLLSSAVLPRSSVHYVNDGVTSILSRIICITPDVQLYRKSIREHFVQGRRKPLQVLQQESVPVAANKSLFHASTPVKKSESRSPDSTSPLVSSKRLHGDTDELDSEVDRESFGEVEYVGDVGECMSTSSSAHVNGNVLPLASRNLHSSPPSLHVTTDSATFPHRNMPPPPLPTAQNVSVINSQKKHTAMTEDTNNPTLRERVTYGRTSYGNNTQSYTTARSHSAHSRQRQDEHEATLPEESVARAPTTFSEPGFKLPSSGHHPEVSTSYSSQHRPGSSSHQHSSHPILGPVSDASSSLIDSGEPPSSCVASEDMATSNTCGYSSALSSTSNISASSLPGGEGGDATEQLPHQDETFICLSEYPLPSQVLASSNGDGPPSMQHDTKVNNKKSSCPTSSHSMNSIPNNSSSSSGGNRRAKWNKVEVPYPNGASHRQRHVDSQPHYMRHPHNHYTSHNSHHRSSLARGARQQQHAHHGMSSYCANGVEPTHPALYENTTSQRRMSANGAIPSAPRDMSHLHESSTSHS